MAQESHQFLGLPTLGKRQQDISIANDPQISVQGFDRMQEQRRGPGTRQRAGNLLCDAAALSDSRHEDSTGSLDQKADRLLERVPESCSEGLERSRLLLDHFPTYLKAI